VTLEEKIKWLENASAEELLKLYVGLANDNRFGKQQRHRTHESEKLEAYGKISGKQDRL